MKGFNSQASDREYPALNEHDRTYSLSSLLKEFMSINKDNEYALSNHLISTLRLHFGQPRLFLEKFQSMADIRTYSSR